MSLLAFVFTWCRVVLADGEADRETALPMPKSRFSIVERDKKHKGDITLAAHRRNVNVY